MADQITEAQLAILKMCRWGDSESVKEALLKGDVDPHAKEEQFDGRSALHLAADVGCRGVVQLLLEVGGVDVNVADDWMDWNPLVWAAKHVRVDVVKFLLDYPDTDPNVANLVARTPLMLLLLNYKYWPTTSNVCLQAVVDNDRVDLDFDDKTLDDVAR